MLLIVKPHGIFDQIHTLSNHWHAQKPVLIDEALSGISPTGCGQLVRMLITGIFGSNMHAYLF